MATTKTQLKAEIKGDIKHVLEESCGLEPKDIPHEIFSREAKQRTHDLLALQKDELHKISHRVLRT